MPFPGKDQGVCMVVKSAVWNVFHRYSRFSTVYGEVFEFTEHVSVKCGTKEFYVYRYR